jgi:hypothetical protein
MTVVFVASGCANPGIYWKDRGLDFIDCFKWSVGYGGGVDVHVKITEHFSIGFGGADTTNIGMNGRKLEFTEQAHFGMLVLFDVYTIEYLRDKNFKREYISVFGIVIDDFKLIHRDTVVADRFDIEASATAILWNIRVGFRAGQFVDFLLGWFGLDIGYDDTPLPESSAAPPPEAK